MSRSVPFQTPPDPDRSDRARPPDVPGAVQPVRISRDLFQAAAERLVSQSQGDLTAAAKRLITTAPAHGIDLSMAHATVDVASRPPSIRQACLPVLGAGRTAMMFVSEPPRSGDPGGPTIARGERVACLLAACEFLAREHPMEVAVAQGLPDPKEAWAIEAYLGAGFLNVGQLAYMRRALNDRGQTGPDEGPWPDGVSVENVGEMREAQWKGQLVAALDRSYEHTLDCPELCGLRATVDILASHQATGEFDPRLWWLVRWQGEPHGCLLLNACPEQRTVELVYIGLSPALRGRGLARRLLAMGTHAAKARHSGWSLACAVDLRNTPALKLYGALAFRAFGERVALVRRVDRRG